ncbi:hypothetical protein WR25_14599 [Diploscapter pachys]|uniref:C3H1-type domain-containing protein n=1 Tax=Diploscapter pachys TaxID=2018661 RepID=A0A2A2LW57_9BILA|nr:hypothetical protein WR25_14599 [Diploscapter pachys]
MPNLMQHQTQNLINQAAAVLEGMAALPAGLPPASAAVHNPILAHNSCLLTDEEREQILKEKRRADAFKTALCDSYRKFEQCQYGERCRFAHGVEELRMPVNPRGRFHPKYKTVLCDKFSTKGFCQCMFIHKIMNPEVLENREVVGKRLLSEGADSTTSASESAEKIPMLNAQPSSAASVVSTTSSADTNGQAKNGGKLQRRTQQKGGREDDKDITIHSHNQTMVQEFNPRFSMLQSNLLKQANGSNGFNMPPPSVYQTPQQWMPGRSGYNANITIGADLNMSMFEQDASFQEHPRPMRSSRYAVCTHAQQPFDSSKQLQSQQHRKNDDDDW